MRGEAFHQDADGGLAKRLRERARTNPHSTAPASFYGVVTSYDESLVEFFHVREDAERFLERVRQDDPELAAELRVEVLEVEQSLN
jgi:hypothetical protein